MTGGGGNIYLGNCCIWPVNRYIPYEVNECTMFYASLAPCGCLAGKIVRTPSCGTINGTFDPVIGGLGLKCCYDIGTIFCMCSGWHDFYTYSARFYTTNSNSSCNYASGYFKNCNGSNIGATYGYYGQGYFVNGGGPSKEIRPSSRCIGWHNFVGAMGFGNNGTCTFFYLDGVCVGCDCCQRGKFAIGCGYCISNSKCTPNTYTIAEIIMENCKRDATKVQEYYNNSKARFNAG